MTPLVFPPGKNIRFRWIGAGVLVIGAVVFGIVPVLGFALTRSPSAIPLLLGLPVALLAGAGLWLVGTRRRIEISPDQVTWSPLFEGRRPCRSPRSVTLTFPPPPVARTR